MKRDYFKREDILLLLSSPHNEWEKEFDKKVIDYKNCALYGKGKYQLKNMTLFGLIMMEVFGGDPQKRKSIELIKESIQKLDAIQYTYSINDFNNSFSLNKEKSEAMIYILEKLKEKDIPLELYKKELTQCLCYERSIDLTDYLIENNLLYMEDIIRKDIDKIEQREYLKSMKADYESQGIPFFRDFLGDSLEKKDPDIEESIQRVFAFIKNPKTTQEELRYVLGRINHNKNLLAKYINEHKLDVGFFSHWDFIESLSLKPKEVYDAPNIAFIKELEKRLEFQFFIKGKKSAKNLLKEAKDKSDDGLNKGIAIEFKDGSQVQIDSRGKSKTIKPKK